jgi:hypothetical protein
MSLPTPWVDKIFEKLTLVYGQSFLRRWADIDLNAVKSDWAHELSGFQQHPKAIAWALQNLPTDRPPTVLEFKFLARRAPPDELPRLESPKADAEVVARELERLAPLKQLPEAPKNTDWAKAIVARHEGGARIAPATLRCAKQALATNKAAA